MRWHGSESRTPPDAGVCGHAQQCRHAERGKEFLRADRGQDQEEEDDGPEQQRGELAELRGDEEERQADEIGGAEAAGEVPEEVECAEPKTDGRDVRGDETGMGEEIRFQAAEREGDGGGPAAEEFACPAEQQRAQKKAEQDVHEARAVEHPVSIVVAVHELVAEKPLRSALPLGAVGVETDAAGPSQWQCGPHAGERRMLGVNAVVTVRQRRVAGGEMLWFVPSRRFLGVTADSQRDEERGEQAQN